MNYVILMERYLLVRYNAATQVIIFSNVANSVTPISPPEQTSKYCNRLSLN